MTGNRIGKCSTRRAEGNNGIPGIYSSAGTAAIIGRTAGAVAHNHSSRCEPLQTTFDFTVVDTRLMSEMTRRGITEKKARELLLNVKPDQELLDQLEYTDSIIQQAPAGKFHNLPGLYIRKHREQRHAARDI